MSLPLSEMISRSQSAMEPFQRHGRESILTTLREGYKRTGLEIRVLPLTEINAGHIQQQDLSYKRRPTRVTADQLYAIQLLSQGFESVEIGELTEPHLFMDYTEPARPSKDKYQLSLIAAFGQALPVRGRPEMPATERPHIWYYYGFDEAGTAYHLAFQD